ncbi:hypothetical protein MVLG_02903 [Microbotryum lychnidis-dioicae p1A1 Lamole]|uniref:Cyclin-domain-containing protein n=1 Tax=Microbotryum lychnidis-dioicae (strain p1A1 Lamole / MvSl-1064) TaxID=683840 RepID=U5H6K4_USTV1|nr:hypothetical protein MVLG_02903 [Microbotryum lychnidis-dioicae p1A1 Lamole]|eukprot:KDE06868.1 hypothetical protein MVLG_02903 [Microbotryum lychnidis-dioicae p1A1 Lamole]
MDPTNANAVAGPSRLPAQQDDVPTPASVPVPVSTTSDPAVTTATTTAPESKASSSSRGPKIVPTVIDSDGLRVVPNLFELCQVNDLISLIASMLDRLIQHNDRIPLTPSSLTRFHSRAPPSINVKDYLVRIARYTNVEPCCLLILLPYVDKVCARMTTFTISSLTVHRFIIAGVSVGSKALSDSFCTNGRYARVGGVGIAEMNLLEKELCEAIDWRLTTTGTVLAHYYTSLVTSHPQYRLASPLPTPMASTPTPAHEASVQLGSTPPSTSLPSHGTTSPPMINSPAPSSRGVYSSIVPTPMDPDGSSPLRPIDHSTIPSSVATTTTAASSTVPASLSSLTPSPVDSTSVAAPSRVLLPQGLARHLLNERSASAASALVDPSHSIPSSTSYDAPVVGPSPALIPAPKDKRSKATASNLPSPVRSATMSMDHPPPAQVIVGTVGDTATRELLKSLEASTAKVVVMTPTSPDDEGVRGGGNERMSVDAESRGESDEELDDGEGVIEGEDNNFPPGTPIDSYMTFFNNTSPTSTSSSPDMTYPTSRIEAAPSKPFEERTTPTTTTPGKRTASHSPYQTSPSAQATTCSGTGEGTRSRKVLMTSS